MWTDSVNVPHLQEELSEIRTTKYCHPETSVRLTRLQPGIPRGITKTEYHYQWSRLSDTKGDIQNGIACSVTAEEQIKTARSLKKHAFPLNIKSFILLREGNKKSSLMYLRQLGSCGFLFRRKNIPHQRANTTFWDKLRLRLKCVMRKVPVSEYISIIVHLDNLTLKTGATRASETSSIIYMLKVRNISNDLTINTAGLTSNHAFYFNRFTSSNMIHAAMISYKIIQVSLVIKICVPNLPVRTLHTRWATTPHVSE